MRSIKAAGAIAPKTCAMRVRIAGTGVKTAGIGAKIAGTAVIEMIKHHVKEEEQRGGMCAKAKTADLDLRELGAELKARKDELMQAATRRN